jgi:hypothetical protein
MTRIPNSREIESFRVNLEAKLRFSWIERGNVGHSPLIDITLGSKYAKITTTTHGATSVYGFIDRNNGDLLKAASWTKPAKHPRGNIFAPDPLAGCTDYGLAYLR